MVYSSTALLLLLLLVASPSAAASAEIFKIAVRGDAAPGGNGAFEILGNPFLADQGHVFFWSSTIGGPAPPGDYSGGCIFRFASDGSDGTALLCEGEPVDLPGTDIWLEFSYLDVNASGHLAFQGRYLDGAGVEQRSVFLFADGVLTLLATKGDVITTDSVTRTIGYIGGVRVNDADTVVFESGSLFEAPAGGSVEVLVPSGAPLPDDPSRYLNDIGDFALSPSGEVAYGVFSTDGEDSIFIIYTLSSGVFSRLATSGTAAGPGVPGTVLGAEFFEFSSAGLLFAEFQLADSPLTYAVLRWNGSAWAQAVSVGPSVTRTLLLGVAGFDDLLWEEREGSVYAAFVRRSGYTSLLAATGDPAPGSGGATFGSFPRPVGTALGGLSPHRAAAAASLTGGSGDQGIFAFGALPVPALSGRGWIVLTLALFGVALPILRRVGDR